MMKSFKTISSLATFLFLSIMAFSFSSCSNDGDEKEDTTSSLQPFVGYWQHLDENEEYHSILTITENGNYQFRYQDGEDIGTDGGMVSFDKKSNNENSFKKPCGGLLAEDAQRFFSKLYFLITLAQRS